MKLSLQGHQQDSDENTAQNTTVALKKNLKRSLQKLFSVMLAPLVEV
jgi:hypothetical protein